MSAEEAAWLDEQMAAQMDALHMAAPGFVDPPVVHALSEERAPPPEVRTLPPRFIETSFTTRAAYEAWLSAGADPAVLPA